MYQELLIRYQEPVRKEPNYLFLTISLLAAVVVTTAADSARLFAISGFCVATLTFMVTAYIVIESRRQLLLAALLGISALLPFGWLVIEPEVSRRAW